MTIKIGHPNHHHSSDFLCFITYVTLYHTILTCSTLTLQVLASVSSNAFTRLSSSILFRVGKDNVFLN